MKAKTQAKIILLVEDNPDDLFLALDALEKNNIRSEVVVARDGKRRWITCSAPGLMRAAIWA